MKKKISAVFTVTMLLVMMFSICAIAEYGVNTNYSYYMKCLQNKSITSIPAITPKFTTTSRGAGTIEVHMDHGTITSIGTLVQSVEICYSDGTLTGVQVSRTEVPVRGLSSYIDRKFISNVNPSTPYKSIFESDDNYRGVLTQVVVNYN